MIIMKEYIKQGIHNTISHQVETLICSLLPRSISPEQGSQTPDCRSCQSLPPVPDSSWHLKRDSTKLHGPGEQRAHWTTATPQQQEREVPPGQPLF